MKKLVIFIIFNLYLTYNLFAQEHKSRDCVDKQQINDERFIYLGNDYAKDNWTVFYRGRKIENASASSFEYINDSYAKDNWTVFYKGQKIEGASTSSFQCLNNGYAKVASETKAYQSTSVITDFTDEEGVDKIK